MRLSLLKNVREFSTLKMRVLPEAHAEPTMPVATAKREGVEYLFEDIL